MYICCRSTKSTYLIPLFIMVNTGWGNAIASAKSSLVGDDCGHESSKWHGAYLASDGGGSSSVSRKVPNGFYPLIPGENIFNTQSKLDAFSTPVMTSLMKQTLIVLSPNSDKAKYSKYWKLPCLL